MCILQQATNISWWWRIFHGGDFDALTGAKFSQWERIFRANISPGAKYTQQGGDKYRGAILIHDTGLQNYIIINLNMKCDQIVA